MQLFILDYPNETVRLDDFFDIKRTIDARGSPLAMRYMVSEDNPHECRYFTVDLKTGRFDVHGQEILPTDCGRILTDRPVKYRPVWFRRWYRTFDIAKGEIDARWAMFLGWQFTENGRNNKRMIRIDQDGTVGVG